MHSVCVVAWHGVHVAAWHGAGAVLQVLQMQQQSASGCPGPCDGGWDAEEKVHAVWSCGQGLGGQVELEGILPELNGMKGEQLWQERLHCRCDSVSWASVWMRMQVLTQPRVSPLATRFLGHLMAAPLPATSSVLSVTPSPSSTTSSSTTTPTSSASASTTTPTSSSAITTSSMCAPLPMPVCVWMCECVWAWMCVCICAWEFRHVGVRVGGVHMCV